MTDTIDDGFGNIWLKCGPKCGLHIVRPGHVQCDDDACQLMHGVSNNQPIQEAKVTIEKELNDALCKISDLSRECGLHEALLERCNKWLKNHAKHDAKCSVYEDKPCDCGLVALLNALRHSNNTIPTITTEQANGLGQHSTTTDKE